MGPGGAQLFGTHWPKRSRQLPSQVHAAHHQHVHCSAVAACQFSARLEARGRFAGLPVCERGYSTARTQRTACRYSAPEVVWASKQGLSVMPASAAVDCWALGVIAAELLAPDGPPHDPSGSDAVRVAYKQRSALVRGLAVHRFAQTSCRTCITPRGHRRAACR